MWRVTGESLAGAEACIAGPLADVVRGRSTDDLTDLDVGAWPTRRRQPRCQGRRRRRTARPGRATARTSLSPDCSGTSRHEVETDVTVSAGDPAQLVETARKRVADGFRVLKLKVGTDPESDVGARPRGPRGRRPDVRIRVDANQGWTVHGGDPGDPRLEDAGVDLEFVEQPVDAADLDRDWPGSRPPSTRR